MGVFSHKYLEYQWVVMHPLLLPIYTYHGANITIWLNIQNWLRNGEIIII